MIARYEYTGDDEKDYYMVFLPDVKNSKAFIVAEGVIDCYPEIIYLNSYDVSGMISGKNASLVTKDISLFFTESELSLIKLELLAAKSLLELSMIVKLFEALNNKNLINTLTNSQGYDKYIKALEEF